jgi:hypothetical protein
LILVAFSGLITWGLFILIRQKKAALRSCIPGSNCSARFRRSGMGCFLLLINQIGKKSGSFEDPKKKRLFCGLCTIGPLPLTNGGHICLMGSRLPAFVALSRCLKRSNIEFLSVFACMSSGTTLNRSFSHHKAPPRSMDFGRRLLFSSVFLGPNFLGELRMPLLFGRSSAGRLSGSPG